MIIEEGHVTDNHCVSGTLQRNQHRVFLDVKLKMAQRGLSLVSRWESASFFPASCTHQSLMYLPHSYSPMSQGAGYSFMKLLLDPLNISGAFDVLLLWFRQFFNFSDHHIPAKWYSRGSKLFFAIFFFQIHLIFICQPSAQIMAPNPQCLEFLVLSK